MHGLANVKKGTTSVSPHVVKIAGISSFNRLKTLQHLGGFTAPFVSEMVHGILLQVSSVGFGKKKLQATTNSFHLYIKILNMTIYQPRSPLYTCNMHS